ncbi:hypothetical protein TELCIR_01682 [Teladorsagia circumcincta]|uniref:Inhibitor of growth protein N-terminal histone-binding domain-containing protein n=1 Tax=Teladorsagia circumcincta TaxID=45464 RepID=A0A2G9V183_TELCI|nr:hypothetical protein TELCIR_01682 [Teladorsagia circumcincta]
MSDQTELLVKCMNDVDYLPNFLSEHAERIREIDSMVEDLNHKIQRDTLSRIHILMQLPIEERTKLYDATMEMYGQIERLSDRKVQLAKEMYEAVERYVQDMDGKLVDVEATCRHLEKIHLEMSNEDEPVYCTCKQVSFGNMIACENPDCEIEWFHYGCVGLSNKPEATILVVDPMFEKSPQSNTSTTESNIVDCDGGRTASDIVSWTSLKGNEMIPSVVVFAAATIVVCSSHGGVRNHSTEIIHRDSSQARAPVKSDYIRPCYFTNWAQYR